MAKWGLALSNLNELRKPVEMIATKQQMGIKKILYGK